MTSVAFNWPVMISPLPHWLQGHPLLFPLYICDANGMVGWTPQQKHITHISPIFLIKSSSQASHWMMHSCQFCQRPFTRWFNRDRHETVSCPKQFDEEEAMTRFSNEEEGLERRAEKYYEYDDEENNYNEDGDELKPTRTMLMATTMMTMRMTTRLMTRTKAMMGKKLTMAIQRVTQKMRKLILGINCLGRTGARKST